MSCRQRYGAISTGPSVAAGAQDPTPTSSCSPLTSTSSSPRWSPPDNERAPQRSEERSSKDTAPRVIGAAAEGGGPVTMSRLSPEHADFFARHGYLHVPRLLAEDVTWIAGEFEQVRQAAG